MAIWKNITKNVNVTDNKNSITRITSVDAYYEVLMIKAPGKQDKELMLNFYNYSFSKNKSSKHKTQCVHINRETAKLMIDILKKEFNI